MTAEHGNDRRPDRLRQRDREPGRAIDQRGARDQTGDRFAIELASMEADVGVERRTDQPFHARDQIGD
jgi:hypothetical protein